MATIVTRSGKGSPLTNNEVDANFNNLNTEVGAALAKAGGAMTGAITTNSTFDGRDVATDGTKLDGVEASADVTDTANVTSAGALMDSELTSIASVKALNQGLATGNSPTFVNVTATSLDISGNIDVDGVTNLDVVDIDGAVDMASTLAVAGVVTANAGVVVDTMTLDGSTLTSTGDFIVDAAADIIFDADANDVLFKDGGVEYFRITNNGTSTVKLDAVGDIILDADGGDIYLDDGGVGFGQISGASGNLTFKAATANKDIIFQGNDSDGSNPTNMLVLDASAAGTATFNAGATFGSTLTVSPDTGATTAFLTLNNGNGNGTLSQINLGYRGDPDHGNIKYTGVMSFQTGGNQTALTLASNGTATFASSVTTGGAINNNAGSIVIGTTSLSQPILQFLSSTSGANTIHFGDGSSADAYRGYINYSHSNDRMEFATAGGERMRIDSAGRVGIGTNSPSAPLTVNGTNAGIRFTDASQNVSNYYGEIYKDYNGNAPFIIQSKSNGIGVIALNPDGGNVGIGTNSPTFKLHQSGTGLQRFQIDATDNNVNGSGVYLRVLNSGSVVSQSTIAIDNVGNLKFFTGTSSEAERVRIDALGRVGIGTTSPATYGKFAIRGGVTVNAGSTSLTGTSFSTSDAANATFWINHASATTNLVTDASMAFYTASGSGVAERMRIDTSGNLLVRSNGATPSSSQAGISLGLSGPNGGKILIANTLTGTFAGAMVFVNGNGQVGSIATSGSATSYVTSSDQRLKESIIDADDAGNKIDAIQVRQFDWKVDGEHQDYGMVAQELQSVAPEAVSGDADSEEMMGVDYSKLVPMLIKEIQSLRQRVASLEG